VLARTLAAHATPAPANRQPLGQTTPTTLDPTDDPKPQIPNPKTPQPQPLDSPDAPLTQPEIPPRRGRAGGGEGPREGEAAGGAHALAAAAVRAQEVRLLGADASPGRLLGAAAGRGSCSLRCAAGGFGGSCAQPGRTRLDHPFTPTTLFPCPHPLFPTTPPQPPTHHPPTPPRPAPAPPARLKNELKDQLVEKAHQMLEVRDSECLRKCSFGGSGARGPEPCPPRAPGRRRRSRSGRGLRTNRARASTWP
jgi:hypothetical protein